MWEEMSVAHEQCGTAKDGQLTGPDRSGSCAMANEDTHAVCVKLPQGFCGDTGQDDWCSKEVGGPWCICMWAYSEYVEKNGCVSVAVNMAATDKEGICAKYKDDEGGGGRDLTKAKECLGC